MAKIIQNKFCRCLDAVKSSTKFKTVIAIVIVLTILVIGILLGGAGLSYSLGHRCFLDVLNASIEAQCTFLPFYAGSESTPPTRVVMPALGMIEDNWDLVRDEMEDVLAKAKAANAPIPYMHNTYDKIFYADRKKQGFISKLAGKLIYGEDTEIFTRIGSPDWRTYNLLMFGQNIPGNADQCPATMALLKQIPGVQSALFSIVAPHAYIPPHSDPAKGVIRYHLALRVPKDRMNCFIEVSGERYNWTEGKGVLFDDVFDHWVRNDTEEERVILFVDILRPLSGLAACLQALANKANKFHPGVKRAIKSSIV